MSKASVCVHADLETVAEIALLCKWVNIVKGYVKKGMSEILDRMRRGRFKKTNHACQRTQPMPLPDMLM